MMTRGVAAFVLAAAAACGTPVSERDPAAPPPAVRSSPDALASADVEGTPLRLYLATYPLTRAPAAFADRGSE